MRERSKVFATTELGLECLEISIKERFVSFQLLFVVVVAVAVLLCDENGGV